MIYGYARCSTNESKQDISRQVRELEAQGATKQTIYLEYESGINDHRAEFNKLLAILKIGDVVVTTEVSRLTRSTKHLCDIIEFAKNKKLKLIIGTLIVDFSKNLDPMTEGMLMMMGVYAKLERDIVSNRIKSGLANAKAKGSVIGRKKLSADDIPLSFLKCYNLFIAGKINISQLASISKLSRPTVYKYIRILQENS